MNKSIGPTEIFKTHALDGNRVFQYSKKIIREVSLEILLHGEKLVSLACIGCNLEELAIGFLKSEGLISSPCDVDSASLDKKNFSINIKINTKDFRRASKVIASSGAQSLGGDAPEYGLLPEGKLIISPRKVLGLMAALLKSARLHDLTRGTHCSGLADSTKLIVAREDIGRHNTIDMLGGYALLNGIDCSNKILLTTGRISSEITGKALRMGVPMIISHSAPTSQAIKTAQGCGMTLGWLRPRRQIPSLCQPAKNKAVE